MFCYKEELSEFIPTHGATNGVYICCELDNLLKNYELAWLMYTVMDWASLTKRDNSGLTGNMNGNVGSTFHSF